MTNVRTLTLATSVGKRLHSVQVEDTLRSLAPSALAVGSDQLIQAILKASPDAAIVFNQEGRICGWNIQAEHYFGWTHSETIGRKFVEVVVPQSSQNDALCMLQTNARTGSGSKVQLTAMHRSGAEFAVEVHFSTIDGCANQECVAFLRDVRKHRHSELERALADVVLEVSDGVLVTDAELTTLKVNNTFTRITGYGKREAVGSTSRMLKEIHGHLLRHRSWSDEIVGQRKNGELFPAKLRVKAVFDENECVTHYVASFNDLSSKKALQNKVNHLTNVDQQTGLPNRGALFKAFQHLSAVKPTSYANAVILIDLDNFRNVNERHGYSYGDALLKQFANQLRNMFRPPTGLWHFGGDAFLLLLNRNCVDRDQTLAYARDAACEVQQTLSRSHEMTAGARRLTCSIGISVFRSEDMRADILVGTAEFALREAKQSGGDCIRCQGAPWH